MRAWNRAWVWILGLAVVAVLIVIAIGPGQAMLTRGCDYDCPLLVVNAQIQASDRAEGSESPGTAHMTGVAVSPRDCAVAAIRADIYRAGPNAADREYLGEGSATVEDLAQGARWPFEITLSGFDRHDDARFSYEWSEFRCERAP